MRRVRAALADQIHRLPRADLVHLHPRLQRDGIAIREVERTLCTRVLDLISRAFALQLNRRVARLEIRKLRRPRPRLITPKENACIIVNVGRIAARVFNELQATETAKVIREEFQILGPVI